MMRTEVLLGYIMMQVDLHCQGCIWSTISPTSFWEFSNICDKKSQNDSEGVGLDQGRIWTQQGQLYPYVDYLFDNIC